MCCLVRDVSETMWKKGDLPARLDWPGHGRCALLQSMSGSSNNVPSSPSLWPMASSGGPVTASIVHIERAGCLLGVLSHIKRGPLIQAGDRHFPFPCKGPSGCEGTDLPIASQFQGNTRCCSRDGVRRGWLGFALLPRQRAGAARHSHGSEDLLPQGHHVSPGCRSSSQGRHSAGHRG